MGGPGSRVAVFLAAGTGEMVRTRSLQGATTRNSCCRWWIASPLAIALGMTCGDSSFADTCSDLQAALAIPSTTLTIAQSYVAGSTVLDFQKSAIKAPVGLCRVAGTVKPGARSN